MTLEHRRTQFIRGISTRTAGSGANPPKMDNAQVGNVRSFQAGLKYSF